MSTASGSPYDGRNIVVIAQARSVVRICVEEIAQAGKLQEIAENQEALVLDLALGILGEYLITGRIATSMIERWVMEAIRTQMNSVPPFPSYQAFRVTTIERKEGGTLQEISVYRGVTSRGQVIYILADTFELNRDHCSTKVLFCPDAWLAWVDNEHVWVEGETLQ